MKYDDDEKGDVRASGKSYKNVDDLLEEIFGKDAELKKPNPWVVWFEDMTYERKEASMLGHVLKVDGHEYADWRDFWKNTLAVRATVRDYPNRDWFEDDYHKPMLEFYFTKKEVDGQILWDAVLPFRDATLVITNMKIKSGEKYMATDAAERNQNFLDDVSEVW
jgi:hypothetical protein